ncbi:MAG TPA: hypothetical protein VGP24_17075 [Glaciihabitans sp.]|jgi:hypothetical protein|nr:hypothetical protein [Glaciihabitans sp.]
MPDTTAPHSPTTPADGENLTPPLIVEYTHTANAKLDAIEASAPVGDLGERSGYHFTVYIASSIVGEEAVDSGYPALVPYTVYAEGRTDESLDSTYDGVVEALTEQLGSALLDIVSHRLGGSEEAFVQALREGK